MAKSLEEGPKRVIAGQATLTGRSIHNIRYDPVQDEIVAPNPVAQAVLVFRGGADGDEAPIRVIQGPRTRLWDPDHVEVSGIHNEIYVPDGGNILVFPQQAKGDVAPIRVIEGPDTKIVENRGIAIDPVHELIIVAVDRTYGDSSRDWNDINKKATVNAEGAILIFKRTDHGNVKPLRMIGPGPVTNFYHINELAVSPRGWILVRGQGGGAGQQDSESQGLGGMGVWSINDNGDVPPHFILKGVRGNMTLNPKAKELIVGGANGLRGFSLPEIF